MNEDNIKKKLISSDIYICTSRNEVFSSCYLGGYVLLSSYNIYRCRRLENFNKKYNFGFIIKNKSINNFKKSIIYFYKNKKLREKFGNKSALCVSNEMNIKKSFKKFEKKLIRL